MTLVEKTEQTCTKLLLQALDRHYERSVRLVWVGLKENNMCPGFLTSCVSNPYLWPIWRRPSTGSIEKKVGSFQNCQNELIFRSVSYDTDQISNFSITPDLQVNIMRPYFP